MITARYVVTGLTCQHCVDAVTTELHALDGVEEVTVELAAGDRSTVTVTSAAPLGNQQLAQALDEAGDYRLAGAP